MSESMTYWITDFKDVTGGQHGVHWQLFAKVVPTEKVGTAEEPRFTNQLVVNVEIGKMRLNGWSIDTPDQIEHLAFGFGCQELIRVIRAGTKGGVHRIRVGHGNYPDECPFDVSLIQVEKNVRHEDCVERTIGFRQRQ